MQLKSPFIITSRLLPGIKVNDGYISIEYEGKTSENRQRYRYWIDLPSGEFTGNDLKSGVGGGNLRSGMEGLLSFLNAAAESYKYRIRNLRNDWASSGENEDLFDEKVVEWSAANSDEIGILACEIGEQENLIED